MHEQKVKFNPARLKQGKDQSQRKSEAPQSTVTLRDKRLSSDEPEPLGRANDQRTRIKAYARSD